MEQGNAIVNLAIAETERLDMSNKDYLEEAEDSITEIDSVDMGSEQSPAKAGNSITKIECVSVPTLTDLIR